MAGELHFFSSATVIWTAILLSQEPSIQYSRLRRTATAAVKVCQNNLSVQDEMLTYFCARPVELSHLFFFRCFTNPSFLATSVFVAVSGLSWPGANFKRQISWGTPLQTRMQPVQYNVLGTRPPCCVNRSWTERPLCSSVSSKPEHDTRLKIAAPRAIHYGRFARLSVVRCTSGRKRFFHAFWALAAFFCSPRGAQIEIDPTTARYSGPARGSAFKRGLNNRNAASPQIRWNGKSIGCLDAASPVRGVDKKQHVNCQSQGHSGAISARRARTASSI